MTVTMIDGINADVPAILARWGAGTPVACYVNGAYTWSLRQEQEFGRKIRISVEAGQPEAAKYARVLDVERFDAGPGDVGPFLAARAAAGHADATIYCNLSTVATIPPEVREEVPRWWLAWYVNPQPNAAEVLNELHDLTRLTLPLERLWACQWRSTGNWDQSVVYGAQDWSR